jgi:alginate O-acetyltransferase complex protein AlgI
VLPLGLSFFTFQKIALIVDAYRGRVSNFEPLGYVLFVSFFPQLIAGPIVHHSEVMPQFAKPETVRGSLIAAGLSLFVIGLAKKVLLADNLAQWASPVFDSASAGLRPSSSSAWIAAMAYSLQLYFDFSGYSDMAIGLARLFGIRLPLNFNSPYKAANIIDFWRRWHMTLSRFLRDYLYIPLGGNRRGPCRRYLNLAVTMLLGGLWHGASWTFVIWGGLHALYLGINHAWIAVR